jgi:hypothetical protein
MRTRARTHTGGALTLMKLKRKGKGYGGVLASVMWWMIFMKNLHARSSARACNDNHVYLYTHTDTHTHTHKMYAPHAPMPSALLLLIRC